MCLYVIIDRPGHEIVEKRARFSIKIQDKFTLISDYPSDLPDFRLSEVVRWPAINCAWCHPSASEWTWRSRVQVQVQSECTQKGRTFGAGQTGTAKDRSIPSQWQPGQAATGSILWSSVSQWVSPCETKIDGKSIKFYRKVNNIKFSTVTFLCENANSMEVSRSCLRGTLLASACSILRVSIDDQVNVRLGNKIA